MKFVVGQIVRLNELNLDLLKYCRCAQLDEKFKNRQRKKMEERR